MLTNDKQTYKARIPVPVNDHTAYQLVIINPDIGIKAENIKKYIDMILDDQTRYFYEYAGFELFFMLIVYRPITTHSYLSFVEQFFLFKVFFIVR